LNASALSGGDLAIHEREAAAGELEVAGQADQVLAGDREYVVEPDRPRLDDPAHEVGEEMRDLALVQREQHLFLAREVEVDGALGEPGGGGDLGDRRHALGMLHEEPLGGVEDGLAPLFLLVAADGTQLGALFHGP
jgi:hypothetical protein